MQRKIVALLVLFVGLGIMFLGMLQTNFSCDKTKDSCALQSSIPALKVNIDSVQFKLSELNDVKCVRRTQASRGSGRRAYFELILEVPETSYVLETCPNLKICRRHADKLLDYKNLNQGDMLNYNSALGVSNIMGIIMGIAMIIFGLRMFFDKNIPEVEDSDEE